MMFHPCFFDSAQRSSTCAIKALQPWHFRIGPAASSIDNLSGPRFAESALPIKHLRAAMFPCLCEPVVAFLHSIGVQGDIFCSGVQ